MWPTISAAHVKCKGRLYPPEIWDIEMNEIWFGVSKKIP